MPRYFFNLHIGEDVLKDPEGRNLRDADQAWEAAKALAESLMRAELPQPVNWASCHVEVTDDMGEIILEFPILEALQFVQPPHRGA